MSDVVLQPVVHEQAKKTLTPEQIKKKKAEEQRLKKACADFESIFAYNLIKSMRKNIPSGGIISKSSGRENWEMMLDQHVAQALSQKGQGLGMQTVLYNQMKKRLKVSE